VNHKDKRALAQDAAATDNFLCGETTNLKGSQQYRALAEQHVHKSNKKNETGWPESSIKTWFALC